MSIRSLAATFCYIHLIHFKQTGLAADICYPSWQWNEHRLNVIEGQNEAGMLQSVVWGFVILAVGAFLHFCISFSR